jgi:acyl-CoA reductase-like NAD-dependent aldehyde dehydrogenase
MIHLPIYRFGRPYRSLDIQTAVHHRTREPFVEVSYANAGLIRRDLMNLPAARAALARVPIDELMTRAEKAAEHFLTGTLPLDPLAGTTQSPQDYVEQVSATTGLPWVMARRNMRKVHGVLSRVREVFAGLTRGLDPRVLDEGVGQADGRAVSFFPRGHALGVVLPNNSPGVHALWAPAPAMKMPVVLKPGSAEPWTPARIVQAFLAAGYPPEAFGYYPAEHGAAAEVLRLSGRGMVFGDVASTSRWKNDPRIEVHGPGYSKVVLGEDEIDNWQQHLDVLVTSAVDNGGRSCVNASGVWVPRRGREVAEALAARFAAVTPKPAEDEAAQLAPFADPGVASRISAMIDRDLREAGAVDLTQPLRGNRLVQFNGCTYLLPTVVWCERRDHPLANREFLFPFVSVVEVPEAEIPDAIGPSLVVTAITRNEAFARRFTASPHIDRLNLGAIPTMQIGWDQPHEGNLFDHLYGRRAIQQAVGV